jgi:hypothetical protein
MALGIGDDEIEAARCQQRPDVFEPQNRRRERIGIRTASALTRITRGRLAS